MGFELTIAAKRDPRDAGAFFSSAASDPAACTTIILNGTLDAEASRAVLRSVTDLGARATDSILIRMEEVDCGDPDCLTSFAAGLMALRGAGTNVQVVVDHDALHETMRGAADARDWLVDPLAPNVGGPRRALHLDGTSVREASAGGESS